MSNREPSKAEVMRGTLDLMVLQTLASKLTHSLRRVRLPQSRPQVTPQRRRMFLCRPFLQPLLRVRHLLRLKASSA